MLSTNLKSFATLRRVMGMLLLCCAQYIAHASEVKPVLTASELSEEQLFLRIMKMAESDDVESKIKPEELKLTPSAWDQLLHQRGAAADPYVLKMLNYYLGESPDSGVFMSLVCRRGRILSDLRKIKKRGPQCDPKYQKLCADQELWRVKIKEINKIISNKDNVYEKYCTKGWYSPEVMQAPLKRK